MRMSCPASLSRLSLPLGAGSAQKPMLLTVLRSQIPPQPGTWKPTSINNKNPWITAISENMRLCNKELGSWLMRKYLIYRNSSLPRQADLPCVKQAFLDRLLPTARAMFSTSSRAPLHRCAVLGWTSLRWEWSGCWARAWESGWETSPTMSNAAAASGMYQKEFCTAGRLAAL